MSQKFLVGKMSSEEEKRKEQLKVGSIFTEDGTEIIPSPSENIGKYKKKIETAWNKCAESILQVCNELNDAKENLEKDVFERLLKQLPFGKRTAERLLSIGRNDLISTHIKAMPPSWGTLYEISTLENEELEQAVTTNIINPTVTKASINKFKKELLLQDSGSNANNSSVSVPEPDPYEGMVKAVVVYCNDDEIISLKEKLSEMNSIQGVKLDTSVLDGIIETNERKQEREILSLQKKGRRNTIQYIKNWKKEQRKKLSPKSFRNANSEVAEFLENDPQQYIENPIGLTGENEIDNILHCIGSEKMCSDFENDEWSVDHLINDI